jgi:death on curing protein
VSRNKTEPRWLTSVQVKMLHAESLNHFGGSPGIRDETLLESALGRPQNKWVYDDSVSLFELAAAYGFGIARNHAFIDGNKRTALLSMRTFLFSNGYRFSPEEIETVTMIEGLAQGAVDEELIASWLEANSKKR